MQNLRDQLLKAGLITEDQRNKADHDADKRSKKGRDPRDNRDRGERPPREARDPRDARDPREGGDRKPEPDLSKPKISKKALMKQPVNRMLDLSDPNMLRIFQAIEQHRVREETKGEIAFHFTLRDGRVRKLFVKKQIFEGLEAGRLAIVESGAQDRHVIVVADAVPLIREVDPEAVRFANL